jgi:hypothetical protein
MMVCRATFVDGRRPVAGLSTLDLSLFFNGYPLPAATFG